MLRGFGVFGDWQATANQNLPTGLVPTTYTTAIALAMQTLLKNNGGATNLPIDGIWGPCSQTAYINYKGGTVPGPGDVIADLNLDQAQVTADKIAVWDNNQYGAPTCGDNTGNIDTTAMNSEVQVRPLAVYLTNMGIAPADISSVVCPPGSSLQADNTCQAQCPANGAMFIVPDNMTVQQAQVQSATVQAVCPSTNAGTFRLVKLGGQHLTGNITAAVKSPTSTPAQKQAQVAQNLARQQAAAAAAAAASTQQTYLIVGGLLVLGVLGYMYMKA